MLKAAHMGSAMTHNIRAKSGPYNGLVVRPPKGSHPGLETMQTVIWFAGCEVKLQFQ